MQELELKMEGGLMREGGVIAGFYGIYKRKISIDITHVGLAPIRIVAAATRSIDFSLIQLSTVTNPEQGQPRYFTVCSYDR